MASKFLPLIFVFAVSCSQPIQKSEINVIKAEPEKAQVLPAQVFPYNFDELLSASNYLATLMIQRVNEKTKKIKPMPILPCDPTEKEINIWSMQIKSLVDEQIPYEQEKIINKTNQSSQILSKCSENCSCGDYAALFRSVDVHKLTRNDLYNLNQMDQAHSKLSDKDMLACSLRFKSFCKSKLRSAIKVIAQ